MIQFIVGLIFCSLIISTGWSKCLESSEQNNNLWKPNFGSTNLGTVNIPLKVNGQQSCYHQSSALSIEMDYINEQYTEFEFTPMGAEFENVPDAEIIHYVDIEEDEEKKSPKIHLMSFLCSGEYPIGADAYSNHLEKIVEAGEDKDNSVSVSIANGNPTSHLSVNQEKKAKAKVYFHFIKLFEDRNFGVPVDDLSLTNIFIPNVMSGVGLIENKQLYSTFFSRTNSSLNACSKIFRERMTDLDLQIVVQSQPFRKIEIRKKLFVNKYRMKWITK